MRSRSLSRSSANEEGKCRLSRNEINAQGAGLGAPAQSFRRASPRLLRRPETKGNAVSPRRYGQRKVGGEQCRAVTTERLFRPCLRALGRVLSLAYTTEWCAMHCRHPPSSTPNRNSFHPFSRTCLSSSAALSRNILFPSLSLSLCLLPSSPVRLLGSWPHFTPRSCIKQTFALPRRPWRPGKAFRGTRTYVLCELRAATRYQVVNLGSLNFSSE